MKKFNIIGFSFLVFFAIVGFLSIILYILGFRPIKENSVKPDWDALSAIATIFAVFTALFITKWQDMLNNRKELKIEWGHTEKQCYRSISFIGFPEERRVDEIVVRFINTGNRKIVLSSAFLHFPSNTDNHLIPEFITPKGQIPAMTFPCEIEPENCRYFTFPCSDFINAIKIFMKTNHVKDNDVLLIVAKDTTGKEYKYNTKLEYQSYLKLNNQQAEYK
jgi:hypothetical protein